MSSSWGLNLKIHSSSLTQCEASVTEGFSFCMSRWASRLTTADHWREMVPVLIETQLPELTGVSLTRKSSGLLHSTYLQITLGLPEPGSRGRAPRPHQPHTLVRYLLPHLKMRIFTKFLFQVAASTCCLSLPLRTAGLTHRKSNH